MPLDKGKSAFTLPKLPYAEDALAPVISAKTISFHYGKHHKAYVDKLNELVAGTPFENQSLEEIIPGRRQKTCAKTPIFNNAAQAWNHDFFWHSHEAPKGGGKPAGDLATRFDKDLGGLDKFRDAFKQAAVDQFGSGWAWLIPERQARHRDDIQCRHPDRAQPHAAASRRRVGACLLRRLPEPPPGSRPGLARQARQLVVRREEARLIKEEISCLAPFF